MKESSTMESVSLSVENEALSEKAAMRMSSTRTNEYEVGQYLFLPMRHFCVDVPVDKEIKKSKRVIAFKLNSNKKRVDYARTFKLSHFTESLAFDEATLNEKPKINFEMRDGLRRIPKGVIDYIPSVRQRVPKHIDEERYFHISAPFIIDFKGTIRGLNPKYSETAPNSGVWDLEVDEENHVLLESTRITQFDVLPNEVSNELIVSAKECLKADSQLKTVPIEC